MAITRRTAITKHPQQQQQQQQEATPLPPTPTTTADVNSNNNEQQMQLVAIEAGSGYEQTREQRIKENRERLHKLGILDLSLQLKSAISTRPTSKRKYEKKTPLKPLSLPSPQNIRRSSRLQNAPPVTYTEPKEEKSRKTRDIVLEEGAKPEFYTEEHDKLLGHTEMPWTFFVDGYRADGTRIYDPVNGKTCHQCRQKTLGQRTRCSKCSLVQGQFCGDCLMMRYGEHVVEANQNPNWICPPCRGICNCSLCRQAKGWYPTGALYKRISNLGFKSVAHYLIATKRAPPESEKNSDATGMELQLLNNDDKAVVEGAENSPKSEDKTTTIGEQVPKSEGVGRSRKRSKKEIESASDINDRNTSPETVDESNSKPVVRRSGRKSMNEKADVNEEIVDETNLKPVARRSGRKSKNGNADVNEETVDERNSKPVVRRSGRKSKNGNADVNEETVDEGNTKPVVRRSGRKSKNENAVVNKQTVDESNLQLVVWQSARKSKNENAGVIDESVKTSGTAGNGSASTLMGLNGSDSIADSIGRRLRSRNRTSSNAVC